MAPFSDFIEQLFPFLNEQKFHIFSCGHVIPKNQLLPLCIERGPSGIPFTLNFERRNDPDLIREVGQAIVNYTNVVPGGMVVFFASYDYMNKVFDAWLKAGIVDRLKRKKAVYAEPSTPGESDSVLKKYIDSIRTPSSKQTGALLCAVVGGKMSEGINFSDELARCVIMVGIPFANIKSQELVEKMKYMDTKVFTLI